MKRYSCDNQHLHTDYFDREIGDNVTIKGVEYRILRIDWAGSYDYDVELAPLSRLSQYIN